MPFTHPEDLDHFARDDQDESRLIVDTFSRPVSTPRASVPAGPAGAGLLPAAPSTRRDPRVTEAVRLVVEHGLNHGEAARRMGVTRAGVSNRLSGKRPPDRDNARKRRWANTHRLSCPACGAPMVAGSARSDGSPSRAAGAGTVCVACLTARRVARRVANVLAMVRLRTEAGLSNGEIAKRLGASVATVAQELSRLRTLGFEVPRDPSGKGGRPRRQAGGENAFPPATRSLGRALAARGIMPPHGLGDTAELRDTLAGMNAVKAAAA